LTIVNPRPVPTLLLSFDPTDFVENNGSKIFFLNSFAIPGPVSATEK
jgi:hypothetical protein